MDYSKAKYKLSQYNVFHQDGDVQYLWNTYSDALVKLDKDGQEYIRSFAGTTDKSFEFDLLKTNGFIVYDGLNEFGRVCLEEKQAYFTLYPEEVSMVIVPGMGCNCKCSYCFQKTLSADRSGVMTLEIAERVAEYICEQLKNNRNAKKLDIVWFGGEPLLYLDTMEIISLKLIDYTRKNNIEYSAGIATNGLLLDEKCFVKLQKLHINVVQVTIDGTCDLHCRSKGVSPEQFNCVIDNACRLIGKTKLFFRLNIPNNDVKEAIAIADYLFIQRNLSGKVFLQFAYLCDYTLSYKDSREGYINYIHNFSIWVDYLFNRYGLRIPYIKRSKRCFAVSVSRQCIGTNGELYTFLRDVGNTKKVIGNIWQGRFFNDVESMYYSTTDLPSHSKCFHCKYLPVCMGESIRDCLTGIVKHDCKLNKKLLFKLKLLEAGILLDA